MVFPNNFAVILNFMTIEGGGLLEDLVHHGFDVARRIVRQVLL
jgi:hypothetical protein